LKKIGLRVLNLLEHDMLRHFLFVLKVVFLLVGSGSCNNNQCFFMLSPQPFRVAGVLRLGSELRLKAV
jgi:hypothetical protein